MAKFYLQGIPETPAVSTQPQAAQVAPVKGGPAQFGTVNARVQNIDIAKNIPSLMQRGLPEDLSNALVGGQLRTGQAWAGAAESLGNLAETAGKIAAHMQYTKDVADRSRIKNLIELNDAAFNEEVATKNLNGMQALELSQSYHERLDADIGSLGLSRENLDQAGVDTQLYKSRHRTNLLGNMRNEQIKSDADAIETRINQAISKGDIDGAMNAVEDGVDAKVFNPGQAEKWRYTIKNGYDEFKAGQDLAAIPQGQVDHLEEAVRTGKSEWYPNLNHAQLQGQLNRARSEVDNRQRDAIETIDNGIAAGTVKTPDDVDNLAGGNVGAQYINKRKEYLTAPREAEYSSEAMAKVEGAIDNYVKESPGSGSPEFHRIHEAILFTTPKNEHEDLYSRLKKKRDADPANLPGKDWFPDLLNEFTQMTEDGRFIGKEATWYGGTTPALDLEKLKKDPEYRLEHKAEIDAMWDRTRSMQIIMREWRQKNPGNDEKTIIEARKFQNELLKNADSQAGLDAVRKATQTQLPATGPMGTTPPTTSSFFATDEEMIASGGRGPNYPAAAPAAHTVREVTAYRPGATRAMGLSPAVEGKDLDAHNTPILGRTTMEDYLAGRGPYVTVAMDKKSAWQNKYLTSPQYPGVVFRVRDNGGYGNNRTGLNWIDIAWKDPQKAKANKLRNVQFQVIDADTAKRIRTQRGAA